VRTLERQIAAVVRAYAVRIAAGEDFRAVVEISDVHEILGAPRFDSDVAEETEQPGVVTGLAWTPNGGEILFVEASRMPGSGKLVLTGQLGDVMKESAQAALSYVRSHASAWGVAADLFLNSDFHLHFPAGGIPKDGPSAGQALVTAIVSVLTARPVRGDIAMTGEITLRGNVLPVGGISSKVLAAHRAGIKTVILPERNAKDVADLPAEVLDALELVFVKKVDETISLALVAPERPLVAHVQMMASAA
jgi:ATP-dependent Lon protease